MVAAVRRGRALRAVARPFRVRVATVAYWVQRAGERRLDRVAWHDRPKAPRRTPRTTPAVEDQVLRLRKELADRDLGSWGAAAIREALRERGRVVFLRRTDEQGRVEVLGRRWCVALSGPHRLVRAEVDWSAQRLRFYALRRRDPGAQPLLREEPYQLPNRRFRGGSGSSGTCQHARNRLFGMQWHMSPSA